MAERLGAPRPEQPAPAGLDLQLVGLAVEAYLRSSKAEATLRAYRSDWRGVLDWCLASQLQALPAAPQTLSAYLAHLAP